jgi:hypothetical protein
MRPDHKKPRIARLPAGRGEEGEKEERRKWVINWVRGFLLLAVLIHVYRIPLPGVWRR